MNYRQFAEIAAFVSACSGDIVHGDCPSDNALADYVDSSLLLFRDWNGRLLQFETALRTTAPEQRCLLLRRLNPLLDEIWVSEMLTRVWGAVLAASGREIRSREYETLARHVLICHLNSRRQAFEMLTRHATVLAGGLSRISGLQERISRWTDLLVSHLVESHDVDDFAFNAQRSREFCCHSLLRSDAQPLVLTWTLMLSGLRSAFSGRSLTIPTELPHHAEIVSSILACFSAESLQSGGVFSSALKPQAFRHVTSERALFPHESTSRALTPSSVTVADWVISFRGARARSPEWTRGSEDN